MHSRPFSITYPIQRSRWPVVQASLRQRDFTYAQEPHTLLEEMRRIKSSGEARGWNHPAPPFVSVRNGVTGLSFMPSLNDAQIRYLLSEKAGPKVKGISPSLNWSLWKYPLAQEHGP
ncbi:hypothetical protein TWF481_006861 [Arthrobotrys musiformis]|uniref:Uncharacterized protein n=1 Tax=Arthrobotrys musiformis TaxID=47236 RepID=A0AAV9WBN7_9PEZI